MPKRLMITSWATVRIDDESGKKYWELGGESWKDGQDMEIGESVKLSPDHFDEGSQIQLHDVCDIPAVLD